MINAATACTTVGNGVTWPDVAMGVVAAVGILGFFWIMYLVVRDN
jgi:hypothetical protein